jgi:hypothetical protein
MLLAFAPFIAFAIVDRLLGSVAGLFAGAAVSAALLIRDLAFAGKTPKLLDIGSGVLFSGLGLYAATFDPDWSIIAVRLYVDCGLFLIVIFSLVSGKPFTIQYARETVPEQFWDSPEFLHKNYVISSVWALAFAILIATELTLLRAPQLPPRIGIFVIVGAIVGALKFTGWYSARDKTVA